MIYISKYYFSSFSAVILLKRFIIIHYLYVLILQFYFWYGRRPTVVASLAKQESGKWLYRVLFVIVQRYGKQYTFTVLRSNMVSKTKDDKYSCTLNSKYALSLVTNT